MEKRLWGCFSIYTTQITPLEKRDREVWIFKQSWLQAQKLWNLSGTIQAKMLWGRFFYLDHTNHPNGSQEGVFWSVFYHFPKLVFLRLVFFSPNLKIGIFLRVFFSCVLNNGCFLIGCFFSNFQKFVILWVFFYLKNAIVLLKMYLGIFSLGVFLGRFQKLVFFFGCFFWFFFLI